MNNQLIIWWANHFSSTWAWKEGIYDLRFLSESTFSNINHESLRVLHHTITIPHKPQWKYEAEELDNSSLEHTLGMDTEFLRRDLQVSIGWVFIGKAQNVSCHMRHKEFQSLPCAAGLWFSVNLKNTVSYLFPAWQPSHLGRILSFWWIFLVYSTNVLIPILSHHSLVLRQMWNWEQDKVRNINSIIFKNSLDICFKMFSFFHHMKYRHVLHTHYCILWIMAFNIIDHFPVGIMAKA